MLNATIASIFDEIADYMEFAGENTFKIRAYRRAAEALKNFENSIEETAAHDDLRSIDGLGEAMAAKVREYLSTGNVSALEQLRAQYPSGLLDLMRIPGLGPKRVSQLFQERQISDIEALKLALDSGALQNVAGFGSKTLANIRENIQRIEQLNQRLPLTIAHPLALVIVADLIATGLASRVEFAGSLRRGCDTLGDINLLASTTQAAALLEAFVNLPHALAVEEKSATAASIRAQRQVTVRLQTCNAETFGSEWFFASGSVAHVSHAQQLAAVRGLDLQPFGLFCNGTQIAGHDEANLYETLGSAYIEPELREQRGEWEAAQNRALPNLVDPAAIRGDLHTHSTWSDGKATIRQMAEACRARGYEYFAVTDHSRLMAMANGLDAARLREQAKEIARVREEFPDITILHGVECDILRDGTLDLDDDILHELDIVVASVHTAFNLDQAAQTTRIIKAITHPAVDILGHPTGRILGERAPYNLDINAIIEAARASCTALEINASTRLDLCDLHAFAAREAGVFLAINTDAHSTRMLSNIHYGVLTARRAWCQPQNILNTRGLDDLMRYLQRPEAQA